MTTPTQLQQLARETALTSDQRKIVNVILKGGRAEEVMAAVEQTIGHHVYAYVKVDKLIDIISALEQVSREERKEAQALATALERIGKGAGSEYFPYSEASGDQHVLAREARAALAAWKEKQP